ncbi:MAG: hypothetical protein Q9173_002633 [Seirophora scorigena]
MVPGKGHERLAIACLQHLSSKRGRPWRTVLKNIQGEYGLDRSNFGGNPSIIDRSYPFLVYAAQSWAYHLNLARTEGSTLHEMLFDFLKKDALTWINTVALLGDVTTLLRSAKYLKTFVKRQEKTLGDTNSVRLRPDDPYESKAWAMDLSRFVGKFGSILLSSPSSIYKIVPPFCPPSSMVKNYYEKPQKAFSVTSLSDPDWDDCRAQRLVDPAESASRVLATVDVFVALVPSAHSLIVWHAEICEELRRISHEEYLREKAITKTGDLGCTVGVVTISVWDIASGTLLATVPITRDTHLIGLAFRARDEEILQRFYDLRGTICNVWQPEALVQAEEPGTDDDGSSNADSTMSSGPAEAFQEDYSQSGNWIGSADDSGHILIRKIQIPSPKNLNLLIWKASDFHVNDGVLQLLISPDDRFLLASSSSSVQLFDVKYKNTRDKHVIIFETILPHVPGHGRHRRKRLELFRTAALDEYDSIHSRRGSSASSKSSKDLGTSIAPEDLSTVPRSVFKLVGTYQNEIVFFNDQYWLCSWEIDTNPHTHRKHFALPQDWFNDETLRLTSMTQSGTLLCPRSGEVAIIKGGIKP